tara:strand:- start:380 stop:574 length:195 start_codon:yes stop_codon:yes gene_type:complete
MVMTRQEHLEANRVKTILYRKRKRLELGNREYLKKQRDYKNEYNRKNRKIQFLKIIKAPVTITF